MRKVLDENPGLEDTLRDSMQGPITTLADRFKAMKITEQGVGVAFVAIEDEINIDSETNLQNDDKVCASSGFYYRALQHVKLCFSNLKKKMSKQ